MIKLFKNFSVERVPSKVLSQRQSVPALAEKVQLSLPTPLASTTPNDGVTPPLVLGTNATSISNAPQLAKRKAMEETVADDEERGSSQTPGRMSKKARSETAIAETGAVMLPLSPGPSSHSTDQSEERAVFQSDTAITSAAPHAPSSEP